MPHERQLYVPVPSPVRYLVAGPRQFLSVATGDFMASPMPIPHRKHLNSAPTTCASSWYARRTRSWDGTPVCCLIEIRTFWLRPRSLGVASLSCRRSGPCGRTLSWAPESFGIFVALKLRTSFALPPIATAPPCGPMSRYRNTRLRRDWACSGSCNNDGTTQVRLRSPVSPPRRGAGPIHPAHP